LTRIPITSSLAVVSAKEEKEDRTAIIKTIVNFILIPFINKFKITTS
jgi:hypothetical protein